MLLDLLQNIFEQGKMPEEWRDSVIVPIFKEKGDIRDCGNYRHTKGAKTIKKNTNSTQNKSQTHRGKQYEVTSFLSTDCELSTETCSKNVYSLGPR